MNLLSTIGEVTGNLCMTEDELSKEVEAELLSNNYLWTSQHKLNLKNNVNQNSKGRKNV